ncbi:Sec-independent protein translocase protein TatB [Rubrimonas cliftonensis]|uniref:Sec-independent protein translocase protein TatB n=1 Tax=Rubrimonas cliftonensis TaxID=89524 RepID=A0A1H4DLV9_9RHOB|nr:Sec-independent protein translocase protein TatB [Rubrimonas cliftonensis]SEA73192.1 sec-independent protein translocase protein TatB [Rubrimonas cliftonensis]
MLDIGWSELMVIGALALIVVGPKDLPKLLRSFGKYVNQVRGMARDFQRSMEDAAREADISDMKDLREAAKSLNDLKRMPYDSLKKPGKPAAGATVPPSPKVEHAAPRSAAPAAAEPTSAPTASAPAPAPTAAVAPTASAPGAPAPTEGA